MPLTSPMVCRRGIALAHWIDNARIRSCRASRSSGRHTYHSSLTNPQLSILRTVLMPIPIAAAHLFSEACIVTSSLTRSTAATLIFFLPLFILWTSTESNCVCQILNMQNLPLSASSGPGDPGKNGNLDLHGKKCFGYIAAMVAEAIGGTVGARGVEPRYQGSRD